MNNHEPEVVPERSPAWRVFLRTLKTSWISILSIVVGYLAFVVVTESQDLLLDVRKRPSEGIIFWAGFFLVTYFFWVNMVTSGARLLILQRLKDIGIDDPKRFKFFTSTLPKIFVFFVYLIVFIGLFRAFGNMPGREGGTFPYSTLVFIALGVVFTFVYFRLVYRIVFRALRPHVGVLPAALTPLAIYLILTLLAFLQMDRLASQSDTIEAYTRNHLVTLLIFTLISLAVAIYDNFFAQHRFRLVRYLERNYPRFLQGFNRFCERLFGVFPLPLDERRTPGPGAAPHFLGAERLSTLRLEQIHLTLSVLTVALITLLLIVFHFIYYWLQVYLPGAPAAVTDSFWIKRAAFLPLVFGGTISLLTVLALISYRIRLPVILLLIAASLALTFILGDGHDMRRITASGSSIPIKTRYVDLNASIAAWKRANGWDDARCRTAAPDDPACPRPIIVATEGGASRSAFFTASILGKLEDLSAENPGLRRFGQQLFGISAVSGGSLGAGIYSALLYAEQKDPRVAECLGNASLNRCKRGLLRQRLWFRNIVEQDRSFLQGRNMHQLTAQAISSNDFLTSTIIALLARDALQLSSLPLVWDRAATLELNWEEAVQNALRPMLTRQPRDPYTRNIFGNPLSTFAWDDQHWRPLLVMNATSVDSGRRVLATSLNPVALDDKGHSFRVFQDSYNLYELACDKTVSATSLSSYIPQLLRSRWRDLCAKVEPKPDTLANQISDQFDVPLSTAVSLSARFPFVSPHGNVRNQNVRVVDNAVDGGYFDNSGAVTALELLQSIRRVDNSLRPFVVQISNEPEFFGTCSMLRDPVLPPELIDAGEVSLLETPGDLLALNATRNARSFHTGFELPGRVEKEVGKPAHALFFPCSQPRQSSFTALIDFLKPIVGMTPAAETEKTEEATRKKSVSMSWWLSPPVQAYLDSQLCDRGTPEASWQSVLTLLRKDAASPTPSACLSARKYVR